jgi:DNA-binding transcriptional ArsR family regulator
MSELLDMDTLAQGLHGWAHPIRIRCLILLEHEHSPTELHRLLDDPRLGTVSYHVRMLRDWGLVRESRTESRRGAVEHYYRRTELADVLTTTLAPLLGLPPRRRNGKRAAAELLESATRQAVS